MSDSALVTIRVKSRTGDIYVRAARFFPHDRWETIEVPAEVATVLARDPWLDVRGLPDEIREVASPSNEPATSLERPLEAAHARIEALERELEAAHLAHAAELERSREAHARDLDEVRRRTEIEVQDSQRREHAKEADARPPPRRGPAAPSR